MEIPLRRIRCRLSFEVSMKLCWFQLSSSRLVERKSRPFRLASLCMMIFGCVLKTASA